MCGISGFTFKDELLARKMNQAIRHRGPDGDGIYSDDLITLGHVRLAILDLSLAGSQPMNYEYNGRTVIIVFNGEIYNFQNIRKNLETIGYTFKSNCDTEVVCAAYIEYGRFCIEEFNGMWAFVIYDKERQELFCSRDRLGVKPFYYFLDDEKFIFSSEIKGLLEHKNLNINTLDEVDTEAIDYYYSLGFIPSPKTIFKKIRKLPPRHNIIYNLSSKTFEEWEYFQIPSYKPQTDKRALIHEGRSLLQDSVALRLIADVPVGTYLSGGLDSTSITGIAKKIKQGDLHTFSVGFDDKKFDETPYINIAKDHLGTIHHHCQFTEKSFQNTLEDYQKIFDEPMSDFGFLPSFKISSKAKKYVKVVLTGDGGDEIFGGYTSFYNTLQYTFARKFPKGLRKSLLFLISKVKRSSDITVLGKIRELLRWSLLDTDIPLKKLYPENYYFGEKSEKWYIETMSTCLEKTGGNHTEAARYHSLFFTTMGDSFLMKTDHATMLYGLEARSPFCDYRWIEFASRIPTKWKVSIFNETKILFREMIHPLLPKEILHHKKQGFTPPFYRYIKEHEEKISSFIRENLDYSILPEEIRGLLERRGISKEKYFDILLRSYLLALWSRKWVKK